MEKIQEGLRKRLREGCRQVCDAAEHVHREGKRSSV